MSTFNDKRIREEVLIIRPVSDGYLISDIYLAQAVLCCIENTKCFEAIPIGSKFAFHIIGNPVEIKKFIDAFFSGRTKEIFGENAEKLKEFSNGVAMLKTLLDKAKKPDEQK